MSGKKALNVSEEKLLFRSGNGVKLISPDAVASLKPSADLYNTGYTVSDLTKLSFNIGFSNTDICIQLINNQTAETLGFSSVSSARGKRISSVINRVSAARVLSNNYKALKHNKIILSEEDVTRKDEISLNRISIYCPWYDMENNIIGVYGTTIVTGKQPLMNSLLHIKDMGLLSSKYLPYTNSNTLTPENICPLLFTKRERQCIYYIIRGKTLKETAGLLGISIRTVEGHFERIKMKFNVKTKSEFISKILANNN